MKRRRELEPDQEREGGAETKEAFSFSMSKWTVIKNTWRNMNSPKVKWKIMQHTENDFKLSFLGFSKR